MPQTGTRKPTKANKRRVRLTEGEAERLHELEEQIETEIFDLVNQERRRRGIPAVSRNVRLSSVARNYAQLMASRNEMGHFVGGTNPGQRITAGGYRWVRYGENVARGYRTAQAVMNGWMNSAGHRANILNPRFVDLGVGVATRSTGTKFYCQNFASPRTGRTATRETAPAASSITVEEESGQSSGLSSTAEDYGSR